MGSLSKIKEVSIILLEKISILQIDTLHHTIYPFTETYTYIIYIFNSTLKFVDTRGGGGRSTRIVTVTFVVNVFNAKMIPGRDYIN